MPADVAHPLDPALTEPGDRWRRWLDELVDEGRIVEAVDALAAANRQRPDDAQQRELVRLRHVAYNQEPHPPGRPEWPPAYDDLFAGTDSLPEVAASDLTADALGAGITHHGALLVRNLVPVDVAERLRVGVDEVFSACAAAREGEGQPSPWYAPFEPDPPWTMGAGRHWVWQGGGVWTTDSPRMLAEVIDAFEAAGLREVLTSYLGERPGLSAKKWTLRRVPVDTGTDWHQDGAFLGRGIRSVNVWLALTDCGVDAPGLDLVPQRLDLLETGTNGAQFDWSVGPGTVEAVAGTDGVESPHFRAGDALLFDDVFLHRTGVKPGMTNVRYAIESWFFAPSHYPKDQVPLLF